MLSGPTEYDLPAATRNAGAAAGTASQRFAARVAIVHGNRLVGDLLAAHCAERWGCEVVAVALSEADGLAAIERHEPDLALVGHFPPALDALALLPRLQRASRATKLVVLVARLSNYFVHHLGRTGCRAVIEESTEGLAMLATAISQVRDCGRFLSPQFLHAAARLRADPGAFPKLLSARQEEVLRCIAHAMSDREISSTLGMSARTAQRHRADIARKLNIHGTPQLIRYGAEKGFGSPPPRRAN